MQFLILSVDGVISTPSMELFFGIDKTCRALGILQPNQQPVLIINGALEEALTCPVLGLYELTGLGWVGGRLWKMHTPYKAAAEL